MNKELENIIKEEGNELDFIDNETGYKCFIRRHPYYLILCGYVSIPLSTANKLDDDDDEIRIGGGNINVHGGITFIDDYNNNPEMKLPLIEGYKYIGFDCGRGRYNSSY